MLKVRPLSTVSEQDLTSPELDEKMYNLRSGVSARRLLHRKRLLFISDPLRVKWDFIITLMSVYGAVMIPYSLSFDLPTQSELVISTIDVFIGLFFILDIGVNFHTSYIDLKTGYRVDSRRLIAKQYITKGRFFFDFVSSLPVEILVLIDRELTSALTLVRLIRLMRLFRMGKTILYLRVKEDVKLTIRIVKIIVILVLYLHLLACAWHFVIRQGEYWEPPVYQLRHNGFYQEPAFFQYSFCLYSAVGTLVKFELSPSNIWELTLLAYWIFSGAFVFSYLLGEVTVLLSTLRHHILSLYKVVDHLNTTMQNMNLSGALQEKVMHNFLSTNRLLLNCAEWNRFSKAIPPSLIQLTNIHLYFDTVSMHPSFSQFPDLTEYVVANLEYSFLMPYSILIQQGDSADFMAFVILGQFEVSTLDIYGVPCAEGKLTQGNYCGELGLLYNITRTATITASEYSSVGVLQGKCLLRLFEKYPQLEAQMKVFASGYKDSYKTSVIVILIQNMLRKIGYLRHQPSLVLDELFYSLKTKQFCPYSLVFERGALAEECYFVVQGNLTLAMSIFDSTLQSRMPKYRLYSHKTMAIRNQDTVCKRPMQNRLKRNFDSSKLVELPLVDLSFGSILNATLVLFQCELQTYCITNAETKLLVLKANTLQRVAMENSCLKVAMQQQKARFMHTHTLFNDIVEIPPVLDCYKPFLSHEVLSKVSWVPLRRLRNAVLMVVYRNRQKITSRCISFKAMMDRLRAIAIAEKHGMNALVQKILCANLPPQAVYSAELLSVEEMKMPIWNQFVHLFKQSQLHFQIMDKGAIEVVSKVQILKHIRKQVALRLEEINDIFNIFQDFF